MIEINLATYDKQNEILSSLDGGETLMYILAKTDSTANQSDIEALRDIPHIKNIVNSEAAMRAVSSSKLCVSQIFNSENAFNEILISPIAKAALFNSDTFLNTLLNSDKCKVMNKNTTVKGRFLPLKTDYTNTAYEIYNGEWHYMRPNNTLGSWLRANIQNSIATQLRNTEDGGWYKLYYYDLNA